ncbi:MAG: UvrD-helicase domain-containing protein, partial [Tissierellaceae bacterium]
MELNKDQKLAVESINRNVSVIAGAGTGKTKVLTERFIRILDYGNLDEGKEIESIVAITFTKKATQEMIHRIRSEIRKNFPVSPRWRRYYRDMEKSNISTIHSFCAKILRENPVEAKIDPLFEVLEDNKASRLLKENIRDTLKTNIREENRAYDVIKNFEIVNIELLVNTFHRLYVKIRTVGIPFAKVKDMSLKYLNDLKEKVVDTDDIKNTFIYLMDRLPKNTKIYKLRNDPIWMDFEGGRYHRDEEFEIIKYLYDNMGGSSKEPEKMDFLRQTIEEYLLSREYDNIPIYDVVLNLLIEIDERYSYEKDTLKALDYEDLEIKVLNLLDNKNIRERYQRKFKYIMVDEFQDTNELQKNIFYRLATEKDKLDKSNLFIVGDPNQSIYGFRGADLGVFYDVVGDIGNTTGDEPIVIKVNYRTVNTVLDFINHTFTSLMGEGYTKLASFKSSKGEIDVEILEKQDLEIPSGIDASSYHRYYEAELIAKRIKQLVESGTYSFGDFAMLFRATTRNHIYEKALNKYGIPYYNFGGKGFFQQQEILDVINALKAISNSLDTIAFIGFLRSPMIGMSDTIIYWILRQRENTVLNSMKKIIEDKTMEGEETERIKVALGTIQYLKDYKTFHGLSETINEIISKTYFIESLLLKQGGRQGAANINKLKEMVKQYEKDNIGSVEDLVDLFDELKELDEAQGRVESEDADVVNILTIHKSKGLQFPVVIIPEMATSRNSTFENILFSKDKGIGIKLNSGRKIYDNIREDFSHRESEELKRVLYVAMTRAEEMLILGFQGKNAGFKKMIKEIIHPLPHKIISEIQMAEEVSASVRLIDNKFLKKGSKSSIDLPLLFEVPQFNRRRIERF